MPIHNLGWDQKLTVRLSFLYPFEFRQHIFRYVGQEDRFPLRSLPEIQRSIRKPNALVRDVSQVSAFSVSKPVLKN
jgi:hypothetical protein